MPTAASRPGLLVLASTYPRWRGDPEPGFVHELSRRLVTHFDVTVLCPAAPGALAEELMDGVRVVRYRYAPVPWQTLVNDGGMVANLRRNPAKLFLLPGFFLGQMLAAWRLLRQWRPAVVHAHWLIPQGLVLAVLSLVGVRVPPFLVTSHGADLFALRSAPFRVLKRFVARRAAALAVVSSAMLPALESLGIATEAVRVAPMGVDLASRFTVSEAVRRDPDQLLFVGRLVAKKGLRHLLEALPRIRAEHPTVRLDIVGFGPEDAALREQVLAAGLKPLVRFLGAIGQQELPAMYRRAAVFVAPFVAAADGDQEGLGLVLVEAAGCGCPIVAGDVPAVRDVVVSAEVGSVVPANNAAALASAVLVALQPAARSTEAVLARAAAVQGFDWARRAQDYATLLGSLHRR